MVLSTKKELREKEIIRDLVLLLKNELDSEKIVLFGSRAKNNKTSTSDHFCQNKKSYIPAIKKVLNNLN